MKITQTTMKMMIEGIEVDMIDMIGKTGKIERIERTGKVDHMTREMIPTMMDPSSSMDMYVVHLSRIHSLVHCSMMSQVLMAETTIRHNTVAAD